MNNKIRKISLLILIMACLALIFSACNLKKEKWFADGIQTTELKKIEIIKNREDLTNLIDYSAFYQRRVRAQVTDAYKQIIKDNFDTETRWAVQYGDLAHNAEETQIYDAELDSGFIEVFCKMPQRYGYKTGNNEKNKIYTLDYYLLTKEKNKGISYKDLRLFKNNKGFIKVNNSEQLFYAALNGYFPVWDKSDKVLNKIMNDCIEILKFRHNKNELERIRRTYLYMINESTYDSDVQRKRSTDYRDYAAYYLEGFFLYRQAVCDGLTKAYALLLALDGFEVYHVADVKKNFGGHAYNYVKVNGKYYLSSITNSISTGASDRIRDYRYFLTNYRANDFDGYKFQSEEFPTIKEKLINVKPINYHSTYTSKICTRKISFNTDDLKKIKSTIRYAERVSRMKKIRIEIQFQSSERTIEQMSNNYDVERLYEGSNIWACFV